MTAGNEDEKHDYQFYHAKIDKIFSTRAIELATITVGVTAESAVTPTVIVALSLISSTSCADLIVIVYNLFLKRKGYKWPKLKIISASKAENKEMMAQICCL